MRLLPIGTAALAALLAVSLAPGCGGSAVVNSPAVYEDNALSEVGSIYVLATQANKRPPKGLKDFEPFRDGTPNGISAVARGDLVVCWGAKLNDLSEEGAGDSADEVLAYFKEVPTSGGLVLMKNRKIRKMTADEFKAAPKAGDKPA